MIDLKIMGGMGNQMFQYAFARALSEKSGDKEIVINTVFLKLVNISAPKHTMKAFNTLVRFKLNENVRFDSGCIAIIKAIISYLRFVYESLFVNLTSEMFEERSKKGKYFETTKNSFEYFPNYAINVKNKKIIGYYNSEKYFSELDDILRNEFKVKVEPSDKNKKMIDRISSCNAVCIHIRRGDYMIPQNAFLNICNEEYYKKGMQYIAEHTEDPVFFIFSNNSEDIKWIKENYHFDYPVNYVDLNNPDYEELRLMYNCKHFVICNSTFSWWGSYLSENKDKIVVAPEKWVDSGHNGRLGNLSADSVYRDDMIKLHVDLEDKK